MALWSQLKYKEGCNLMCWDPYTNFVIINHIVSKVDTKIQLRAVGIKTMNGVKLATNPRRLLFLVSCVYFKFNSGIFC